MYDDEQTSDGMPYDDTQNVEIPRVAVDALRNKLSSDNKSDDSAASDVAVQSNTSGSEESEESEISDEQSDDKSTKVDRGKSESELSVTSENSKSESELSIDAETNGDGLQQDQDNQDGQQDDSQQDPEQDEGQEGEQDSSAVKNMSRVGEAAEASMKTGMLVEMMKFFQMLATMLAQALSAVVGSVAGILNAIWTFITGVAQTIATVFSIGATAAMTIVVTTSLGAGFVAVVVIGVGVASLSNTYVDDGLQDCSTSVTTALEAADIDVDAQQLANAKSIYSVLKTYGLSNEQIAGVLGNFSAESGIDPTTIEGIYDEDYNIYGVKHQAALADLDSYTRNDLAELYEGTGYGPSVNPNGYTADDGLMYCGLGMGQYTGGSAKNFLAAAEELGTQWYTVDFQIAYTLAVGAPASGSSFWSNYMALDGSVADYTQYFARYWEGNTILAQDERVSAAESWYELMSSWTVDETYGASVIAMASNISGEATDVAVSKAQSSCVSTIVYNNSTIASAAVAYAYETKAEGYGNNGTELYQRLHDYIWGTSDTYYMSCDRGVATAIRWSGSDDSYPAGDTSVQLSYLISSSKWALVGTADELTMDDLLPGDVFILDGHTFLYVGENAVQAVYPDSDGNSVSASYMERSPGVGNDAYDIIVNRNGQDWGGRGVYYVYRCVDPDNSTTYASAGASTS